MPELVPEGLVGRVLCVELRVARLLLDPLELVLQQLGGVRLLQEEQTGDLDGGVGNTCRIKHPAPRRVLRDEAACNRANCGTD